jgi:uncharacterized protein (TIGR02271 family)
MKSLKHIHYRASALALAGLACAALAGGGCCKKKYKSSSYYSSPTQGSYADISTQPPPPTGRTESATNMVVPLYQENINVGKREVEAGSVRLKKIVRTETVNQPVELRHEELVIDRDSTPGQAAQGQVLGQPFQEQETVIRLKREVPVIEKQTSQSGQIVVQTKSAAQQTNIQGTVRREDIDITKQGDPQNVIIGQNVQGGSARATEASGAAETTTTQTTGTAKSGASESNIITDPAQLTASTDASTLAGWRVQFSGLKVQQVIDERVLVLNAGSGQQIYVLANGQTAPAKPGDMVDVTGSIKATTSGAPVGLSGEAGQTLSSRPFYVEAKKIEINNK